MNSALLQLTPDKAREESDIRKETKHLVEEEKEEKKENGVEKKTKRERERE